MSVSSGIHTIVVERRLPWRVERTVNKLAYSIGLRERVIDQDGLRFRIRRLSADADVVRLVIGRQEYLQHGVTLSRSDIVVDIGGNIGAFAIFAARRAAHVVSVEPDRDNLRLFYENLHLNRVLNVSVCEGAVSGCSGQVSFFKSRDGGTFHTTVADRLPDAESLPVPAISLADLWSKYQIQRCDLLKIDCEGAEFEIIRNASLDVLRTIRQVAMEYHTTRAEVRRELIDRFARAGLDVLFHEQFDSGRAGHLFFRRR